MNQQPQPRQRAPRTVDDWHDRLIIAAQARHTSAVRNNNRNQNAWRDAVSALERSRVKIYVPKSGQHAGMVLGIPAGISQTIGQTLTKIVLGQEPVLLPEHEGRIAHDITDEPVVRKRNYRDSAYAILAALWLEYQGPGQNPQPTVAVQKRAARFTDHDMTYDYRTRKQGAWKAKDDLKRKHLINEERGGGGPFGGMKYYTLTLVGAKACYHMFNEIFHPSKGPYALVEPRHGTVTADGSFYPHGAAPQNAMTPLNRVYPQPLTMNTPQRGAPVMNRGVSFPTAGSSRSHQNRNIHQLHNNNIMHFGGNDFDEDNDFLSPLNHYGLGFEDAEEFMTDRNFLGRTNAMSTAQLPTAQEALSMKRKRMLKIDPDCEVTIQKYLSWGLDEEEAWSLYEQGGEHQTIKKPPTTIKVESQPLNELGMSDSQALDYVLEMSKDDPLGTTDSQDPDYLEAIHLSMIDQQHSSKKQGKENVDDGEHGDEMVRRAIALSQQKSSRWKVMDLTEHEMKTISLVDDESDFSDDDSCLSMDTHDSNRTIQQRTQATPKTVDRTSSAAGGGKRKLLETIHEDNITNQNQKREVIIDLSGGNDVMESTSSNIAKKRKLANSVSTPGSGIVLDLTEDSPSDKSAALYSPQKPFDSGVNIATPPLKSTKHSILDTMRAKRDSLINKRASSATVLDLSAEIGNSFQTQNHSRVPSAPPTSRSSSSQSTSSAPTPVPTRSQDGTKDTKAPSLERDQLYIQSKPSKNTVLTLLVDQRERKKNNTYREFFKGIENYVADRAVMGSEEMNLSIGDFMLALTEDDNNSNSSKYSRSDSTKRWVAEVAIERKCLDDIVSRSAESEGPHFRQERNLRNSLLKYPCFLIEGDLNHTDKSAPRVPKGYEDLYLEQRLDIIHNREELLGYMCGLLSRNYGNRHVILLQSSNPIESSIMLAAISVVVADEFDRFLSKDHSLSLAKLPEFTQFQKHWNGKVRNGRQDLFAGELECESISTHMVQRIERRFGESHALDYVYQSLCQSDANRKLLLTDLSLSASNLREEVISRDSEYIHDPEGLIKKESKKIAELRCPSISSSAANHEFWKSPFDKWEIQHDTVVYHNTTFDTMTNSMAGYADFVSHRLINSSFASSSSIQSAAEASGGDSLSQCVNAAELPWCEIVKRRTTSSPQASTTFRHRSSSIFLVVVQGFDVIEALAEAIDEIGTSTVPSHRMLNSSYSTAGSEDPTVNGQDRKNELTYVRRAWDKVLALFPADLTTRWENEKSRQRFPQLIVLLDNLGRGSGVIGACGRLKNVFADACQSQSSASSSSTSGTPSLQLSKHRKHLDITAARELTSKLSWIMNLFLIVGSLEYRLQPFHCSNSVSSLEVMGTLVNEIHKNALLPYAL